MEPKTSGDPGDSPSEKFSRVLRYRANVDQTGKYSSERHPKAAATLNLMAAVADICFRWPRRFRKPPKTEA